MTTDGLATAVERSRDLAALVGAAWESTPAFTAPRLRAAQGLCAVSLHHGAAVHALLVTMQSSAIALMRPQYESLVRAVWATHAASDAQLERLIAPLSIESQQAAKKLPGVPEMLKKLGHPGRAARRLSWGAHELGCGMASIRLSTVASIPSRGSRTAIPCRCCWMC